MFLIDSIRRRENDHTRMALPPQLSIVIPAFNEARRLPAGLDRLSSYLTALGESWEILVVVEKSRDETFELASRAAAKQENIRVIGGTVHRGKGYAVRIGMLDARGEIIFFMDADLSTPPEEIGTFVTYLERHPEIDVLIGNRAHRQSDIAKRQSLVRRSMGQMFNTLIRILAPLRIRDTQCGFKAFRRKAAHAIFARQRIDGFAFDVETLLLAGHLGFRVADMPVRWINSEQSTVRLVRDSLQMLRDLIVIRCTASRE